KAELNRALEIAAEMRNWSEARGDVGGGLLSRYASGYTRTHLGEFTLAREDLEQGLVLFDPADRPFYAEVLAFDPLVGLLAFSTLSLSYLGYLEQAQSRAEAALTEARRLPHALNLAVALLFRWFTDWYDGREPGTLLQYADELLAVTTENRFGAYRAFALVLRGWPLAALGHADEGIALLRNGLAGLDDSGFMDSTPICITLLA